MGTGKDQGMRAELLSEAGLYNTGQIELDRIEE